MRSPAVLLSAMALVLGQATAGTAAPLQEAERPSGAAARALATVLPSADSFAASLIGGTAPTAVGPKTWRAGAAEPAGWAMQTTDGEPGLQRAGSVRLAVSLRRSARSTPLRFAVDDFRAVPAR